MVKQMLSIKFQMKILKDHWMGKEYTQGKKYRYSLQYNPIAYDPIWIIKQEVLNGSWEWEQPLHRSVCWDRAKNEVYLA